MSQVSKRFIRPEVQKRIEDVFLYGLTKLGNKREIVELLEDFLTPTERIMLSKRFSIAYLLSQEYDYVSISKILKVSTNTVRSVAVQYKSGKGYQQVLNKILQQEELKKFFLDLGEGVSGILSTGGAKSAGWRDLKYEIGKKKKEKPF